MIRIVLLLYTIFTLLENFESANKIEDIEYKYSILIDAGSTGSRVYVYRFSLLDSNTEGNTNIVNKISDSLTEITQYRVHPAMSSFVDNIDGLAKQINDLLNFAKTHINESYWNYTLVSLKATAGLRTLDISNQTYLMENAYNIISTSDFNCNKHDIRVITGNEEALYAYISTIIAFSSSSSDFQKTVKDKEIKFITEEVAGLSAVDLGGSSKQIAFIIPGGLSADDYQYCDNNNIFQLPKLLGRESIYTDSFVGKGLIAIMEHVLDVFLKSNSEISHNNKTCSDDNHDKDGFSYNLVENILNSHPCLSPSSIFPYTFLHRDLNMTGSGDFDKCADLIRNEIIQMNQVKCIKSLQFNRIKTIIGMDNIPKILEMLHLSIDSQISPKLLSEMGRIACKKPWEQLLSEFPSTYPSYRAQRACFGSSYIFILMTEVYGIDENNGSTFLPLETYGKFTLSWPLGAVIVDSLDYLST